MACWKYFFLLCWVCYLFVSAILLFTQGFLLKRDVIPEISGCELGVLPRIVSIVENKTNYDSIETREEMQLKGTNEKSTLFCQTSRHRVILIVVDAFKFEFAQRNINVKKNEELPYQNKLSTIHWLLDSKPNNTRLYKFIADPPTTTMQRLKGITTGSLPTFIDVGSNFATYEINEDNLLDQVKKADESIVFMGDDTWTGLFPGRFRREYSYSSFNVWDLDTVDKGVTQNLLPEIKNKDWKLLIAHFLGIDHCGHRYGPNHPEMSRKLKEVNKILK